MIFLCLILKSQEISAVHIYEYESYFDSNPVFDTLLVDSRLFNENGTEVKHVSYFRNGLIFETTVCHGDTLSYHYSLGSELDSAYRTEYRYDSFGNCQSITSPGETMTYNLEYTDSLLVKSTCIQGCDYEQIFFYNELGLEKRREEYWQSGEENIQTYEYDNEKRVVKWKSSLADLLVTTKYSDGASKEIETWLNFDGAEEKMRYEREIDSHNRVLNQTAFQRGKLLYKRLYVYEVF